MVVVLAREPRLKVHPTLHGTILCLFVAYAVTARATIQRDPLRPYAGREGEPMESSPGKRILIVANQTAGTGVLLDEVERRAVEACEFTLLVPDAVDRQAADWTLEAAQELLSRAAGHFVEGFAHGPDPFEAVSEVVRDGDFDEIIISTFSTRRSKWLRRDLPRRVKELGLPVTVITPQRDVVPPYITETLMKRGPFLGGGPG
jgi:hypothetical protein